MFWHLCRHHPSAGGARLPRARARACALRRQARRLVFSSSRLDESQHHHHHRLVFVFIIGLHLRGFRAQGAAGRSPHRPHNAQMPDLGVSNKFIGTGRRTGYGEIPGTLAAMAGHRYSRSQGSSADPHASPAIGRRPTFVAPDCSRSGGRAISNPTMNIPLPHR